MNYEHIHVFSVVARNGSIAQSCDELHMTRQNISRIIRALESDIGRPLLLRSCNGVRPTQTGHLLLDYAAKLQALEKDFYAKVQGTQANDYFIMCCNQLKSTAENALSKKNAKPYKLNLYYKEMKTILADISSGTEGQFDLLFICGLEDALRTTANEAHYETRTICHQGLGVVVGAGHPLAKENSIRDGVSTNDLLEYEFTSISDSPFGVGMFVEILRNQTGTELNVVSRSNNIDAFQQDVLSGSYCCLSDGNAFLSMFPRKGKTVFLPLNDIPFEIAYLCLYKPTLPTGVRNWVIDAVAQQIAFQTQR